MPITKNARSSKAPKAAPVAACPVEMAINIIGGKWKLLVLRSLILNGAQGYNQLLSSVAGISAKELTRNLGALADSGLVARAAGPVARTVLYELTSSGKGLMPTFESLLVWGQKLSSLQSAESTNISVR
jgi:DNA-binding HxlR family transcriptional regulator